MPPKHKLPVSRTNFNRVRAQTHRLDTILRKEGYAVRDNHVLNGETEIPFWSIELWPRKKREDD